MEQTLDFKHSIDNIYNSITSFHRNDNNTIQFEKIIKQYENLLSDETKKEKGSFYTDISIIRFMLKITFEGLNLVSNPYIKILDPSCGSGNFLVQVYEILKDTILENINEINEKNPGLNLCKENVHEHILKHNIFGADLDDYAVKLTVINLMLKKPYSRIIPPNIICCDSVINWEDTMLEYRKFWDKKFDIIVGNPPYIGHKMMTSKYRKVLNSIYGDVFKDEADISFCFIKSSIDRLVAGGKLCFITARYFLESPSGRALRQYIKNNCNLRNIIDFYGVRIMKGISVDPVIVFFERNIPDIENKFKVIKAELALKKIKDEDVFHEIQNEVNNEYFRFFSANQDKLKDDGWILCPDSEMSIINKIEGKLRVRLSEMCSSFQGIITGCDKAFIVDNSAIENFNIERSLIKKWIKNSCVKKYKVDEANLFIIYSDFIEEENEYSGAINFIKRFKYKLEKRRETLKGVRKWFHLQWGRDSSLFDMKKIVFPYKSNCNRFALDAGSYSSADVYGLTIKDEYKNKISYEFLLGILNSTLYEFYFKSFAKKLGDNMYDYYPNTVMRLMVPNYEDKYITEKVKLILNCNNKEDSKKLMKDIDEYIYNMFEITDNEITVVERRVTL